MVCAEASVGIFDILCDQPRPHVPCLSQRSSLVVGCSTELYARLSTATSRVRMTEESAAHHGAGEVDSDWPNAVHG